MDETVYKRSPVGKKINKKGKEKSIKLKFKGDFFVITKKRFIGRDSGNDIVLNDPLVSRKHAVIEIVNDEAYLKDLSSTNCTYINGNPLKEGDRIKLLAGDIIKIGKAELVIQ